MRIPTLVHGVLDVATSLTLMILPRRLGASPALSTLLAAKGVFALAYSACTRYELGLIKALPMRTHLALDGMLGAGACVLPFLFSNEPASVRVWLMGTGLFELFAAFSTETEPADPELIPGASGELVDRVTRLADDAQARARDLSPV